MHNNYARFFITIETFFVFQCYKLIIKILIYGKANKRNTDYIR